MKTGLVLGLTAAAVIAVGGAIYVSTSNTGPSTTIPQKLFPAVAGQINEIGTLVITRNDGTTTIRRKDNVWTVMEKHDYPAAFDKVRRTVVDLAELQPIEAKTSSPNLFATLDLADVTQPDSKATLLTLRNAANQDIASVNVGKVQPGRGGAAGDGTYVRKAGENQTWLAKGRLTTETTTIGWLDRSLINVARERVARITLVQGGETLVVSRAKATDKNFAMDKKPAAGHKVKSEWDVNQVASPLEGLELDNVLPASELPAAANAGSAEYVTFDGLVVKVDIVDKESDLWLRFSARYQEPASAPTEEETKEGKLKSVDDVKKEVETLNARTANWAYQVLDWKVEIMRKTLATLTEEEKKDGT
jgi:hypothetical protein